MYNQNYEEYMRSVLGYNPMPNDYRNTYEQNLYNMPMNMNINQVNESDMYPEIYKIVYPMVKKACSNSMQEVTEAEVERITMEIFMAVEDNMQVETKVTVQNRNTTSTKTTSTITSNSKENRSEDRNRQRNNTLRDLIKILVLRELLERPFPVRPGPGPRPPFPGGPGRPPFPGGPIRPRGEITEYYY